MRTAGYISLQSARRTVLRLGLALALSVLASTAQAQPANDNFSDAEVLDPTLLWGAVAGDTTGATPEPGEPSHGGLPASFSVWYKLTAPKDGEIVVDTFGSGTTDTILGVYTGSDIARLNQIAANDDYYPFLHPVLSQQSLMGQTMSFVSYAPFNGPSVLRFNVRAGQTYYIAVDAKMGFAPPGPIALNWAFHSSGSFRFATEHFDLMTDMPAFYAAESEMVPDDISTYSTYYQYDIPGVPITVTRLGGSAGRVLVDYATIDLQPQDPDTERAAVAGMDYIPLQGTLVFDNHEMSKTIVLPVIYDFGMPDTNRILGIQLSNPRLADAESTEVSAPRVDDVLGTALVRILDVDIDPIWIRNFYEDTNTDPPSVVFGGPSNAVINFAKRHLRLPEDVNDYYSGATAVGFWLYRSGTNRESVTVNYRINNQLAGNQDQFEQENNYFPLLAGSDYATPDPTNHGSLGMSADYILTQGTVTFGQDDFQPKYISFTVTNDPLTEFNEDFHVFIYTIRDNRPILLGNLNEAKFTILFDDRDPPAGSVDQFHNADRGNEMKPPVATDPPNQQRPGADGTVFGLDTQPDNKAIIVGQFGSYNGRTRNGVARVNVNGSLDLTFDPGDGIGDAYNNFVSCVDIGPDGKILIGGSFSFFNGVQRNCIARLNSNGSLDPTFNPQLGFDGTVWTLAVQQDNKVVVAGAFNTYNGQYTPYICRLNVDGSLDNSFDVTGNAPNAPIQTLALSASGQIIIGGEFIQLGTVSRNHIARLNANGSVDFNFQPGSGTDRSVYAVAVQPDSRILIGGDFLTFNLERRIRLARLNSNGSLDASFDPGLGFNDTVYCMDPQANGTIYVGGLFSSVNGTHRLGFTRLFADGTVDTSFLDTAYNQFAGLHRQYFDKQTIGDPRPFVYSTRTQPDGNVLIAGGFHRVGGGQADRGIRFDPDFPTNMFNADVWVEPKARDGVRNRANFARLLGGQSVGPGNISMLLPSYSLNKGQSYLSIALQRNNGTLGYLSANFGVRPSVAEAGLDYSYNDVSPIYLSTWWPEWYPNIPGVDTRMHSDGLFGTNAVPQDIFDHFWYGYTPGEVTVSLFNSGIAGDRTANFELANPSGSDQFFLGGENIPLGGALGRANVPFQLVEDNRRTNTLGFAYATYQVDEFTTNAVITIVRTNGSAGSVSVLCATSDGTAKANVNYRPKSERIYFGPGVTTNTFTVAIIDDTSVNSAGLTVNLRLSSVSGAILGLSTATLRIIDNDYPPGFVSFSASTYSTNESAGKVDLKVVREGANNGTIALEFRTASGTAVEGVKFKGVTERLVWNDADSSPRFVSVPLIRDGLIGPNTSFQAYLTNATLNTTNKLVLGSIPAATVTIVDDDSYGQLQFGQSAYIVNENGGYATITVKRTGGSAEAISVNYLTEPVTAFGSGPSPNYVSAAGTLNFTPGEVARSFNVQIINDGIDNDLEPEDFYFVVKLTNANPASVIGTVSSAKVCIVDSQAINVPSGSVDTTFVPDPGFNGDVYALAVQNDGSIIAGGAFTTANRVTRSRFARLLPDGLIDPTFLNGMSGANGTVRAMLLQSDGRLVIGGNFTQVNGINRSRLARIIGDGTIDSSFHPGTAADDTVFALAETFNGADRRLLVGGNFATWNGVPRPSLVALANDGTVDLGFGAGLDINGPIYAIAVYPTNTIHAGKVVIAGEFSIINGLGRSRVARLNRDGSLDVTFEVGAGADATIRALGIQADGRILVGGSFTNFNGRVLNRIARLDENGTIDPSFDTSFANNQNGANDTVQAIAIQPDNRILLVGQFTRANGVDRSRITRLLPNGSVDPNINFGSGADSHIDAIALQPDGHIVVGGGFANYDGSPRSRIARVYGGSISGNGAFEFASGSFLADENSTNAVITVRRRGGTEGLMTVRLSTSDGTAFSGINYSNVNGTLLFPVGETFQSILVPVIDNLDISTNLSVNLTLSDPLPPSMLGNQPVAKLWIVNDDSAIMFASPYYSRNENAIDGAATILLVRDGSTVGPASVEFFTTTNGTAIINTNYLPVTNTVTFAPGQTTAIAKVPVLRQLGVQGDRTVILGLTNTINSLLFAPSIATLTIVDVDQAAGRFTFAATNYSVVEGSGSVPITILRTNGYTGVVSVRYTTIPGTAAPGVRYVATNGILTFAQGETTKTIGVAILNTSVVEGDQTFTLQLSNPQGGASILGPTSVPVTILDDEVGVGFSSPIYIANETVGSVTLSVLRVGTNGVTSVNYSTTNATALAGTNYQAISGTLTFTNGEAIKTFNVSLAHDPRVSGDLSFNVSLWGQTPPAQLFTPSSATVVVLDADPGLAFTNANFYAIKSGTNVTISVLRSNANTGTVSVNYSTTNGSAVAGLDYTATSGTLTFSNGIGLQSFNVPILNNRQVRGDREFTIGLFNPSPGTALLSPRMASVTITDDVSGLTFSAPAYSVSEKGVAANIVVYRTGFTNSAVSVSYATSDGTARAGANYITRSGTLVFTNGETVKTISVPVINNNVVEGDKTVLLTLSNPIGNAVLVSPSAATLTIVEADGSLILPAGTSMLSESGPVNGAVDPGETVRLLFGLRNAAGTNTVNSVATLLSTGGIGSPTEPQSYGSLVVHGPAVSREFGFTANGTNGQRLSATFELADGPTINQVVFNFTLGNATATFSNTAPITINDGTNATPYPSPIVVSGLAGSVAGVSVMLTNLSHAWPADINALLVSPANEKVYLMSKAGGGLSIERVTVNIEDSAAAPLPPASRILSGIYKPTAYSIAPPPFPVPAPPAPYYTNLSAFGGSNPNGPWLLYIFDDTPLFSGIISNGWYLTLTTSDILLPSADLGVSLDVSPDYVVATSNLTYTIGVTNYGPASSTNVVVTDTLPAGAAYAWHSATRGSVTTNASGQAVWDVGTLPLETGALLTLVVQPAVAGVVSNHVSVTSTAVDPNPDNDSAIVYSAAIDQSADLRLTMTGGPNPLDLGGDVTYTLTVANLGPGTAPSVSLVNHIPAGATFVSSAPDALPLGNQVFYSLGDIGSGASATVTLVLHPWAAGTFTNIATCSSLVLDPLKGNNSASVKIDVFFDAVLLNVVRVGNSLVFSWPASASGYVLESSPTLSAPAWTATAEAVIENNGFKTVVVPIAGSSQFYRLRK